MATNKTLVSPQITSLEQALASGNTTTLDTFWQKVIELGTPLIEPIEGDDEHHLVTFLWRDQGDTRNVVICFGPAGLKRPVNNQMTRLLETNLWYKTYQVRSDLRTIYLLSQNDPLTGEEYGPEDFGTRLVSDPLNPQQFVFSGDEENPDEKALVVSILELPDAPLQPWIHPHLDGANGRVEVHHLHSAILGNERRVYVYTPSNYTTSGEAYNLLLLFDGWAYIHLVPTPTILDNLINQRKIPPLIAVLPDSLDQETRSRELPCHQPFVEFLTQELLPWVHAHYYVTSDPARTIVAGSSYGGLAAAYAALHAPEHFGNVLSQSGGFWWDKDPEDQIPQEWLTQQFITRPRFPLRFYLEVGLKEDGIIVDMVSSNRHFRDVLVLKGYEVDYTEFNGGHDYICWRGSLADGLLRLVGNDIIPSINSETD